MVLPDSAGAPERYVPPDCPTHPGLPNTNNANELIRLCFYFVSFYNFLSIFNLLANSDNICCVLGKADFYCLCFVGNFHFRVMTMMGAISNCVGVLDDVLNGLANVSEVCFSIVSDQTTLWTTNKSDLIIGGWSLEVLMGSGLIRQIFTVVC